MLLRVSMAALTAAGVLSLPQASPARASQTLFADDFESGLGRWEVLGDAGVSVQSSSDTAHGRVLVLTPNGDDVAALIPGSETWSGVRLEGEMLFPTADDSYLGLLYNHTTRAARRDFGLIYVKGNESYLQLNPHRDLNVSRLIYPEFLVPLDGAAAVEVGTWQRFAVEVLGRTAHVYIGATATPQLTFADLELERGALGLQPRSVGGPVWIDNVRVSQPLVFLARRPDAFRRRLARRRRHGAGRRLPRPAARGVFPHRGCRAGGRTRRASSELGRRSGRVGQGRFRGFFSRQPAAWFDFHRNPAHAGQNVLIDLVPGPNVIVLRVIGGVYASGGFFARVVPPERARSAEREVPSVRHAALRHRGSRPSVASSARS